MAKVIIYLRDTELSALNKLAQREYRVTKAQAALIIRQELVRLGMINTDNTAENQPHSNGLVSAPQSGGVQ